MHRMREKLKKLHRKLNVTMLYVTHNQERSLFLSNRAVLMEKVKSDKLAPRGATIIRRSAVDFHF